MIQLQQELLSLIINDDQMIIDNDYSDNECNSSNNENDIKPFNEKKTET